MPDNQDYAELARLLAAPEDWSAGEAAYMRGLQKSQSDLLSSVHPKDVKSRASIEAANEEIAQAIRRWDASQSG